MSKYERKAQSERKHGPLSISGASKAPISPPIHRPGWKGPGYVKKRPSRQTTSSAPSPTVQEQNLPSNLQQLILDIFRDTFPASQDFETLKPSLREINDALIQNDFDTAFGSQVYREIYAVRWSPSRTLAFANVLAWICNENGGEECVERLLHGAMDQGVERSAVGAAKVVCFGGGAAEVMAFGALLRHFYSEAAAGKPDQQRAHCLEPASEPLSDPAISHSQSTRKTALLDLHLVDAADWSSVASSLQAGLITPPTLSRYASATARASNAALLSTGTLNLTFSQTDVLNLSIEDLRNTTGPDPIMLNLLLTLNDLYTTSIPKTTSFLRKLTVAAPKGSLLLVVDKPGASVEFQIPSKEEERQADEEKKSYQMSWLMDRVLLETTKRTEEEPDVKSMWEKVVDERNRHHRLEEKLRYPGSLENLKFQVHLYRRL